MQEVRQALLVEILTVCERSTGSSSARQTKCLANFVATRLGLCETTFFLKGSFRGDETKVVNTVAGSAATADAGVTRTSSPSQRLAWAYWNEDGSNAAAILRA